MSKRSQSIDAVDSQAQANSDEWTCHYCGSQFAEPQQAQEAHELLVKHIRTECSQVPMTVRARYQSTCPHGNCDF